MVVITNDDDQTGSPGEAVLDLSVGSNTLTVTVTAQDTATTTLTYTVTVERHTADTLVSNTHLSVGPAPVSNCHSLLRTSKRAPTSADIADYTPSPRLIYGYIDVSGASTSVKIRPEDNAAPMNPAIWCATLTNPRPTLTTGQPQHGSRREAGNDELATTDTTYWLTVNEGITIQQGGSFANNDGNDETGE